MLVYFNFIFFDGYSDSLDGNFFHVLKEFSSFCPKYYENNLVIIYDHIIDLSGTINLSNNEIYLLDIDPIIKIYGKNRNFMNQKLEKYMDFNGKYYIPPFNNFWAYLHLFTLTSCFYFIYKKCNCKRVKISFKKIVVFNKDDFKKEELNSLYSYGLKVNIDNNIIPFENIGRFTDDEKSRYSDMNKKLIEMEEKKRKEEEKINKLREAGYNLIESYNIYNTFTLEIYLNDNASENKKVLIKTELGEKYYPKNEKVLRTDFIRFEYYNGKKIEIRPIYVGLPITYTQEKMNYDLYPHLYLP